MAVDLERFVSVLEAARTVPFSAEFFPDGSFRAPYTGPGVHLLLGGDVPDGMDGGVFWGTRVLAADRALYDEGMARQQRGEFCEMEYRVQAMDGRVLWFRECARATPGAGGVIRVDGIVMDVTDQHARADAVSELERDLRATRDRLDSVLAALDEYLYVWRFPAEGPAVIDFESVPQATFLRREPSGGTPTQEWLLAVHPDDRRKVDEVVFGQGAAGVSGSADYRVADREGRTRWLLDRWQCRRDSDGGVVVEGIVSDITSRRQAENGMAAALRSVRMANAELETGRLAAEHASNTDALTGIANRRSFESSLTQAVEAVEGEPFGLLLLDVDHFKLTNDTYGHQVGDDVLVAVAERVRTSIPPDALLGRWGGEEFTVLLRGVSSEAALRAAADGIRHAMGAQRIGTRRGVLSITISCGAVLSRDTRDIDELMHAADAAMYRAKQSGRDRTLLAGEDAPPALDSEPDALLVARSFAHMASVRDGVFSESHCAEVAELAAQVATRLALPGAIVLRCRIAGLLHDVGKIVIPPGVLAKPGALTDEEWRLVAEHAAFGADLIAGTPGIGQCADAVRHHHERWDGDGYPDGLAGSAIPIEARIVAATDTWNAMTQDRVYRSALRFEAASAELLRVAGTQLDPTVTAALLAIVREQWVAQVGDLAA